MSKHTITIYPVLKPEGFDLGEIVCEKLNEVSDGWFYSTHTADNSGDLVIDIGRKTKKNTEVGYGFLIDKYVGAANGGISIGTQLLNFSGDTMTNVASIYASSIYAHGTDPTYDSKGKILSDLTIFIGKQRQCYGISIAPHDSGYTLMSAICGEDANGDPYILYPGTNVNTNSPTNAMIFKSIKNNGTGVGATKKVNTNYVTAPYLYDCGMGLLDNNQKLVMAPFVSPYDGTICTDLYTPICGPMSARIYDLTTGSRKFCTGSSNPPKSVGRALTDAEYQAYYKVFMEV